MNVNDYQQAAARTLISEPDHLFTGTELMLIWCALGLAGEAGEVGLSGLSSLTGLVADDLKKAICHQHGLDRDRLIKELGDVLWYIAGLATLIDVPLSEIMERNIAKLERRYPNGYNSADSKARVDTADYQPTIH